MSIFLDCSNPGQVSKPHGGSNYAFFMGGTTFGKTVTGRSSMQMKVVYSCVRILAEVVAGLPLHLYKAVVIAFRYLLPKKIFWNLKESP